MAVLLGAIKSVKIEKGSMLDLFLKEVSKNKNHSQYSKLKKAYPRYFKKSM